MEQRARATTEIKTAGIGCQPFVPPSKPYLSASATTVEPASATNRSATVKPSTDRSMTYVSMTCVSTVESARRSAMIEAVSAIVAATVTPARAPIVSAAPAISVVPRAGADEEPIRKPVRSIVSVRRASVGRVIIVAVRTCRRSGHVSRPKSYAYAHSNLRLRLDQRKRHQHTQQQKIFKVAHCSSPLSQTGRPRNRESIQGRT